MGRARRGFKMSWRKRFYGHQQDLQELLELRELLEKKRPQWLELMIVKQQEQPERVFPKRPEWQKAKCTHLKDVLTLKTKSQGENWATTLGWFIPRKYRNDIIGDILEDCADMRKAGCTERRIKFHVVYQWLIAAITLIPSSIICILRQVISPPK